MLFSKRLLRTQPERWRRLNVVPGKLFWVMFYSFIAKRNYILFANTNVECLLIINAGLLMPHGSAVLLHTQAKMVCPVGLEATTKGLWVARRPPNLLWMWKKRKSFTAGPSECRPKPILYRNAGGTFRVRLRVSRRSGRVLETEIWTVTEPKILKQKLATLRRSEYFVFISPSERKLQTIRYLPYYPLMVVAQLLVLHRLCAFRIQITAIIDGNKMDMHMRNGETFNHDPHSFAAHRRLDVFW